MRARTATLAGCGLAALAAGPWAARAEAPAAPPAAIEACDADLTGDGAVGLPDYQLVQQHTGTSGCNDASPPQPACRADLSGDGAVGQEDFELVVPAVGTTGC